MIDENMESIELPNHKLDEELTPEELKRRNFWRKKIKEISKYAKQ